MRAYRLNFRTILWLIWLGAVIAVLTPATRSRAQNDTVPDEESEVAVELAAPAPAPDPDAPPPMRRSYLAWLYQSLGLLYSAIFLALSFSLVAVFVMNLLVARREQILPHGLIEGFEGHLNAKQYQQAYELVRHDDSFLGKVLSAGLSQLAAGYEPAVEAMQEVGEEESMRLEHNLSYLALIGNIAPMFGLLGTVDGMVQAFDVIAQSSVSPKPSELAHGIATALVTTLVGLWLAIPAIAAFNILRNRISRLVLEVGTVSESLMRRFQSVTPKRP